MSITLVQMDAIYPKFDVYQRSELPRHSLEVIGIEEHNPFPQKRPPDEIPLPNRPVGRVPVPRPNTPLLRSGNLVPESPQLVLVQDRVGVDGDLAHRGLKVRRRDGRHRAGDIGKFGVVEIRQRGVKEVITVLDGSDHVQWGFARADDGDRAVGDGVPIFDGSQVAFLAQRLQGVNDSLEGLGTGGLHVDEEVERLLGGGIPNAAVGVFLALINCD